MLKLYRSVRRPIFHIQHLSQDLRSSLRSLVGQLPGPVALDRIGSPLVLLGKPFEYSHNAAGPGN